MVQTTKKLRLNMASFNLIKGFSMIVIVLGHMHSSVNYEQDLVLSALFGMAYILRAGLIPGFMLIAGLNFRKKSVWEQAKSAIPELLIPYTLILLAIIAVYPWVAYIQFGSWTEAIYKLKGIILAFAFGIPKLGRVLLGIEVRWCGAAWFLLALCISQNVMNLILHVKNRKIQTLLVVACTVLGYQMIIRDLNFWCIPQGLLCVGYCYAGYLLKKEKILHWLYGRGWVYILLTVISAAQVIWGYFDLAFGIFNNIVFDYIGSGAFGLLLMLAGVRLGENDWKVLDGIKELGGYTLWILCVHTFEMLCFPWDSLKIVFPKYQLLVFVCEAAARIAIIALGCNAIKAILKFKYKRRNK